MLVRSKCILQRISLGKSLPSNLVEWFLQNFTIGEDTRIDVDDAPYFLFESAGPYYSKYPH